MTPIQEYRRAAFGSMIMARVYSYLMDKQRTLIDNNQPCRDMDRAVKLAEHIYQQTKEDAREFQQWLSSVAIWSSSMGEEQK